MRNHARHGFSLIECLVLLVVIALLIAVLAPMLGAARNRMRGMTSAEKLMLIGQGGAMYAQDNAGRLFSYSWAAGHEYLLPSGQIKIPMSDEEAARFQNQEILTRRTGRAEGVYKIRNLWARLPNRRYSHLVLMDYMNEPFGSDLFIEPSDGKQQFWKDHPLDYRQGSSVPYANGTPDGYDDDPTWEQQPEMQRWAFGSSYQVVPDAWQPDRGARYIPVVDSPHLLMGNGQGDVPLADGRRLSSVLHNSSKVWMFEEFDRDRQRPLYFGYDDARVEKLMFDGSVNNWASGDAAPSVVPELGLFHWRQRYVPLDRFPTPVGGVQNNTMELSQRWRWTFGGLSGINYGNFGGGKP